MHNIWLKQGEQSVRYRISPESGRCKAECQKDLSPASLVNIALLICQICTIGVRHAHFLKEFKPKMPSTKYQFCILISCLLIAFYIFFIYRILWAWQWSDSDQDSQHQGTHVSSFYQHMLNFPKFSDARTHSERFVFKPSFRTF